MAQETQDMALNFGDPPTTVNGYVLINTDNGDMEWFRHGDNAPTFVSNKDEKNGKPGGYKWVPHSDSSITNLIKNDPDLAVKVTFSGNPNAIAELADQIESDIANPESPQIKALNKTRVDLVNEFGTEEEKQELLTLDENGKPKLPEAIGLDQVAEVADSIANIPVEQGVDINDDEFAGLRYPEDIDTLNQDYIKITVLEYGQKSFESGTEDKPFVGFTARKFTVGNTIILPIQSSIKDQNTVKWADGQLNPLQAGAAGLSGELSGFSQEKVSKALGDVLKDKSVSEAIVTQLIQKASGATGLFSRLSGAIANPNLELLFEGPQLRPFNLAFFMSPRTASEAKIVRKIIRVFKQYMAVQRSSNGVFLKSPSVFRVQYMAAGGKEHGGINRFKECALRDLSVDYTPGGSYSTFNDDKKTMTAYSVTMSFQELEPVFSDEYNYKNTDKPKYAIQSAGTPAADEIGY